MKIRGEVFPATQQFEFENLKKVRECSSSVGSRRIPEYTTQGFYNGFAKFPVKMLKNPFFWKNFPAKIT